MFCLLIVIPLDFVQLFVGNVGGHHILDLHGYLGVGLDDAVALDLDGPDGVSDSLLSPCEDCYNQGNQSKEHNQANQTNSYRREQQRKY